MLSTNAMFLFVETQGAPGVRGGAPWNWRIRPSAHIHAPQLLELWSAHSPIGTGQLKLQLSLLSQRHDIPEDSRGQASGGAGRRRDDAHHLEGHS